MWTLKKWINKKEQYSKVQIVVFIVWLLSCVWFFVTSWTTACQLPCPSLSPGVCSNSCLLWLSRFTFSGAISNCPLLFSSNILNTLWPGGAYLLVSFIFAFSYCSWCSHSSNNWSSLPFPPPLDHVLSELWPFHLVWPCTTMLIVSLNYRSSFTTTRLMIHEGEIQIAKVDKWVGEMSEGGPKEHISSYKLNKS